MAGADLLDQGGARPGHPDYKNGQFRQVSVIARVSDISRRIAIDQPIYRLRERPGIETVARGWPSLAYKRVCRGVAGKGLIIAARVIEEPAEPEAGGDPVIHAALRPLEHGNKLLLGAIAHLLAIGR